MKFNLPSKLREMKLKSITQTGGLNRWTYKHAGYKTCYLEQFLLHRSRATNGNGIKSAAKLPNKTSISRNELTMVGKLV